MRAGGKAKDCVGKNGGENTQRQNQNAGVLHFAQDDGEKQATVKQLQTRRGMRFNNNGNGIPKGLKPPSRCCP